MTKKDFFRILIKVFGLFSLITSLFVTFPQVINTFQNYHLKGDEMDIILIIYAIAVVAFIVFLFALLIRKPDTIIGWLKLDKGFDDEKIQFEGLTPENILKLSSIIIGGLLIIDHVPVFLSYTYNAFKNHVVEMDLSQDGSRNIHWAASFVDIVIGYVLVTKYEWVGRLLKK